MSSNTMKATKQQLLERVEKLEQEIKNILSSCSCITSKLPHEKGNLPTLENSKEPICLNCYENEKFPKEV